MSLTISIVTYNSEKYIRDCLDSVFKNKLKDPLKVIVVDNNSTDNTVQIVKKTFTKVKIIQNKDNLGFGKAHNQVLSELETDYVICLNPDTLVSEGCFGSMVKFMGDHPDCGISTCKELDFSDNLHPNCGDLPKGVSLLSWIFNLELLGIRENFHQTNKDYYKFPHLVGWVSGSFMMISKKALVKIKGFNEAYFMYFEDVELCYRLAKNNLRVMFNPSVSIKHLGGASSKDPSYRQWSGEIKGLILFYSEEFGLLESLIVKILIILGISLRVLIFSLIGRYKTAKIYGTILSEI